MGLKKYEIITVGSDKRVRALRSWQVGDRYVNIGDIGGIVYDEKTLSQDGLCWLFRGNFGFPGARIGGDSIVDVLEDTISATGAANTDILGSSVVVGAKLRIGVRQGSANAAVLTAADFEQGDVAYIAGANLETQKIGSAQSLRTKSPIFMGGVIKSLKLEVPGYKVLAIALDRDLNMIGKSANTATGKGVTLVVPAAQYCVLTLEKDPLDAIVPADATAAKITYTATYDAKLVIVDSRVELNTATTQSAIMILPGGETAAEPGAAYPDTIIRNSNVVINGRAPALRTVSLISEFTGCNVFIDADGRDSQAIGLYRNVKNLTIAGTLTSSVGENAQSIIQATDCDNFATSFTIFPGIAAAQTADTPFIFQGCNVPDGRFYHHAQIKNTYKNIDFALASEDLGKSGRNTHILVSSEIEGMYRLLSIVAFSFGAAVESYESIRDLSIGSDRTLAASYGTTIYKDAYFNNQFEFAGTNVFGSKSPSHPLEQVLNVQPRVVQGTFNTITAGEVITGVVPDATRVSIPTRIRLNRHDGVVVHLPAGLEAKFMVVDPNDKIIAASGFVKNEASVPSAYISYPFAFIQFRKTGDAPITPEDLAGVTMTVYNGCKISKPDPTSVSIKGNVRVEDNATLYNGSITGTGYFGGNSIVYSDPAAVDFYGTVHMKDNAVFAPTKLTGPCALVHMEGNAKFVGSVGAYPSFIMGGNAIFEGTSNTRSGVVMHGNSRVTPTGVVAVNCRGVLEMEDNASIEASTTVIGAITLAGNYKGDVEKTWVGKRTITDVNEPEYDNNVKSKYDL